jgi:carboxyl-terminal processing protease
LKRVCAILLLTLAVLATGCSIQPSAALVPLPSETPLVIVALGTIEPAPRMPTSTMQPQLPTASPGPVPKQAATNTPPRAQQPLDLVTRQRIFQEVWSIIDTNYLYADFGGVDWAAIRSEFEPRIAEAPSDEAFYQLISAMVGRLGDDHSRFLPPQAAQRQDALSSGREEHVGIGVVYRDLGDGLLLQHVFPGSPAERAGLRPRDRIVAINGALYSNENLQGPEGSELRLTVVRPGEKSLDIVLNRARIEGRITPLARRMPGDIGYLSITTLWVNDTDDQVSAALASITTPQPLRGLIVDLRSNPGGWRSVMTGILSHFTTGEVGTFTSRQSNSTLNISTAGRPDLRGVPLVVLVDNNTASYAELIAAILQGHAGAVVIGMPTSGNTETIYSYELTGGARLWVAQEGFEMSDGSDLEGVGVQPDISILDDWTRFSEADDPGISAAVRLLKPQAGGQ